LFFNIGNNQARGELDLDKSALITAKKASLKCRNTAKSGLSLAELSIFQLKSSCRIADI
jgi:hypothetical protein